MQILEPLGDLQRQTGMAIVLITHDLHLVRRFADRAAVMEQGMLVEQGPVVQLFEHPQHPYTHKLLHSQPVREVQPPHPDAAGGAARPARGLPGGAARHPRLVPQR